MTEFDDIWKKILEKLKEKIDEPSFSAFFGDSFVYSVVQNKVYIATQTNLAALIFNSKYKQLIEEACHDVTQTNYELHFDKLENYEKDKKIVKNEGKLFFKDSKLNPRFTFDTFVIGPSNKEALQASLIVASNPGTMYNPLFIYSDSGLGKTHLLHAIGNFIKSNKTYKNVLISSTSSFIDEYIKGARGEKDLNSLKDYIKDFDVLLIDDIQGLVDHKKTESYFFDLFNYFVDNEKQIVLTCDKLPSELKGIEQRLVTRFSQGLLSKINPPSLETSIEILKSKLIQNGIDLNSIDYDALQFIAEKKSGSVRELEGALNKLLSYTINFKPTSHIDLRTTMEALQDIMNIKDVNSELSEKKIIDVVASYYNLTPAQVTGNSHIKQISIARHIAMFVIRNQLNTPYTKIGKLFGGKDHSTVMSAINKIGVMCKTDPGVKKVIHDLETQLK